MKSYGIFIESATEGVIPIVTDGFGKPVRFSTPREAELEIVDHLMTKLQEFRDGEREFLDAITVDEFVAEF